MDRVSYTVRAEESSDGLRCLCLCNLGVVRSAQLLPALESVLGDDLESSRNITLEESLVVSIVAFLADSKEARRLTLTKSRHFQFRDDKAVSVNKINDLACVHVDIWLDHSKSRLLSLGELFASKRIAVVHQFELSGVDSHNRAYVEVFMIDLRNHPFQKHSLVFQVVLNSYE